MNEKVELEFPSQRHGVAHISLGVCVHAYYPFPGDQFSESFELEICGGRWPACAACPVVVASLDVFACGREFATEEFLHLVGAVWKIGTSLGGTDRKLDSAMCQEHVVRGATAEFYDHRLTAVRAATSCRDIHGCDAAGERYGKRHVVCIEPVPSADLRVDGFGELVVVRPRGRKPQLLESHM